MRRRDDGHDDKDVSLMASDHSTLEELPAWLHEANDSARRIVKRWIRSVFVELCLQVWKKRWMQQEQELLEDDTLNLVVTHKDVKACDVACRQLGQTWSDKLRQQGQTQVARWVDQVVASGQFWNTHSDDSDEAGASQERVSSQQPDAMEQNAPLGTLPLTRVQRLGGDLDPRNKEKHVQDNIRAIDLLAKRGQTDWPYDWQQIQEQAVLNTKRLHSETLKGRPRVVRPRPEYEVVVPKTRTISGGEDAPDEGTVTKNVTKEMPTVLKRYLERKRTKERVIVKRDATSKRPRTDSVEAEEEIPREPSSLGHPEKWWWQDDVLGSFSKEQLQTLETTMLHHDNDDNMSNNTILGALKDVGHYHYCLNNIDQGSQSNVDSSSDDKKRKRAFRRSQKQRLGPHCEEREVRDPNSRWTKVMRVVNNNQKTTATKDWMELDLGECLVELDLLGGEKTLCAFASLEVSLRENNDISNDLNR